MKLKLAFIIYILNLYDYLITSHFVSLYGIAIEMNPIGRLLYSDWSTALICKVVIVAILLMALCELSMCVEKRTQRIIKILAYILLAVYSSVALLHTILFICERLIYIT